jgi:transcriptional regulator with GAF, ATPase, and Fis domain/serine/threonine protein kinase/tetratricopeptide (TPR) repeat protein
MTGVISKRFNVIKTLRDHHGARTFLASDLLSDGAKVVVKVFRKEQFNYERAKLERALAIFTGLKHQHIVPVLEVGFTKSQDLYFIREYIEQSEPRPDVRSIRQLLSTVHFLNSVGYVHGGIKPSNVLLTSNDLKLSDPRICDLKPPVDSEKDIRFRAPEILNGAEATPASDLYSVGALLYLWIAGEDAFQDSEINVLRLKHMWASPKAIAHAADGLEIMARAVLGLLNKNPQKRGPAFQAIVQLLETSNLPATRAPFVGRTETLQQLRGAISESSKKALRTIVIEGPLGIGKSRIIEELSITCGLDSVGVATCCCSGDGPSLYRIIRAVNRLIQCNDDLRPKLSKSLGSSFDALSKVDRNDAQLQSPSYPMERITSDLVGTLAVVANSTAVALVIEDVDHADPALGKFVEQLCIRAAEVPLTLVLTCRIFSVQSPLGQLLGNVLSGDFDHIQLKPLTRQQAISLATSMAPTARECDKAVHLSCGNPLFIEEYARNGVQALPKLIRKSIDSMLSDITNEDQPAIEALSLFTEPIKIDVLAQVTRQNLDAIESTIARLGAIGLVGSEERKVWLHPALGDEIRSSISLRRWVKLNRNVYLLLRTRHQSANELARWSFDGRLFGEAAILYRKMADEDFENRNFKRVAFCYEQLEKCSRRGEVDLSDLEKLRLARSYGNIGKIRKARKLYEKLLCTDAIQNDPKLLSNIYVRLSFLCDKTKASARLAFSRKAIAGSGDTPEEICSRYVHFCLSLLNIGDLTGATNALRDAERHNDGTKNEWVKLAKAAVFLSRGEFRSALDCFKTINSSSSSLKDSFFNPTAIILNIGLCFEHLGDLRKANTFFLQAERSSLKSGHIPVHVLSLLNLGCVAIKNGDFVVAQRRHEEALLSIEDFLRRESEFDHNNFMTVYADIAAHRILTADYKGAAELVSRSKPKKGWVLTPNRIQCELVKCEFLARLGQKKKVKTELRLLDSNPFFQNSFYQTEKNLIHARMASDNYQETLSGLTQSLAYTEEAGTTYQRCEVLNELARICHEMNEQKRAAEFAKRALGLARKKHYRLLGVRALLLVGKASEVPVQKQRYLYDSFREASEMGLRDLVAESAYEIGVLQLSSKNWITAQEYLMRSISVTEEIAEGIPERYRSSYLSLSPHRKALQALKACNPEVQKLLNVKSSGPDFGYEKRYFKGLYELTASTSSGTSIDAFVEVVGNVLKTSLSRSVTITLQVGDKKISKVLRAKYPEELIRRTEKFVGKTKDRIYLGPTDTTPHKPMAWVPLQSPTWEGGVYVECGAHEPTFTEKEIEFLTMVGTIGSSALTAIETRKHDESQKRVSEFNGMIGASKAINDVFSQIQVAASNTATVLIEGESGTGKELVARAIHSESGRAKEPFVAVDCGAIPESLIEAELFGAKKGSYTGATADRPGLFEAAHRGTIFLDEISNTTPALQAKLLRVIQEREIRRIGETKGRSVDVRLIVASNQSLDALVEEGKFRKDLLYRLKVLHLKVPPLRNRRDDIPMLAHAFLQKLNAANKTKKYFAPDVLNRLSTYSFPGNVRELQNAIERAFFATKATRISGVPLEEDTQLETSVGEDVQSWFKDLSEGRKDFWSAVHNRYKRRDISREKVLALVDFGLRSTRGNYKTMAAMFRLKERDYRRFMDFLRRSECLLDFRPYRKLGDSAT